MVVVGRIAGPDTRPRMKCRAGRAEVAGRRASVNGEAIVIDSRSVQRVDELQVIKRLPKRPPAGGVVVLLIVAVGVVRPVTVGADGEPGGQGVPDRDVDHEIAAKCLVVARSETRLGVPLLQFRLVGDEVEGATIGISAVQSSLRATNFFHGCDVHEHRRIGRRVREVSAVDAERHRGIHTGLQVVRTHAADEHVRNGLGCLEFHRRQLPLQVGGSLDALPQDILRTDFGHGNCRVLNVFSGLACRDQHLAQLRPSFCIRLRLLCCCDDRHCNGQKAHSGFDPSHNWPRLLERLLEV